MTGDTTRGLIDTNIVVHLAAIDPALLPDEMVISAITLAELSAGPHHTADPAERAKRAERTKRVGGGYRVRELGMDVAGSAGICGGAAHEP